MAPRSGDALVLLGDTRPELGGSEALAVVHGLVAGRMPFVDVQAEVALARFLSDTSLGTAAHDCSEGGLAVTLAEMSAASSSGMTIDPPDDVDPLWWLFGESTARVVLACDPDDVDAVLARARAARIPARAIGRAGGDIFEVRGALRFRVEDVTRPYLEAIGSVMDR